MELDIDPARFRFEPEGDHVQEVYYGNLFVLIQHYNDPSCAWEQQRALDVAASVLRHRWERISAYQRLQFLAAIDSEPDAGNKIDANAGGT